MSIQNMVLSIYAPSDPARAIDFQLEPEPYCDDIEDALKTGNYVVSEVDNDDNAEWQWMNGALVNVDREEKLVTIRYTRDGTTYELQYEFVDPTGPGS